MDERRATRVSAGKMAAVAVAALLAAACHGSSPEPAEPPPSRDALASIEAAIGSVRDALDSLPAPEVSVTVVDTLRDTTLVRVERMEAPARRDTVQVRVERFDAPPDSLLRALGDQLGRVGSGLEEIRAAIREARPDEDPLSRFLARFSEVVDLLYPLVLLVILWLTLRTHRYLKSQDILLEYHERFGGLSEERRRLEKDPR